MREEALSSFDDIDKVFKQVEGFLHIYKKDKNLEKAAVGLIAAVFHAIECVISFFIKSPGTLSHSPALQPCSIRCNDLTYS